LDITAIDFSRYTKIIDRIAKDLQDKKITSDEIDQEYITQTYNELSEGAANGYGKNFNSFPKDGKGSTPTYLKRNIYAFSGAKSYAVLEKLNEMLVDQDGKLRPFNEFQQLARKVNENFNKNYLQAEYQTARTAAQMAEKWERLQETKDLFPNLKFRTVGDDRVRDDHEKLNGIIKPIDDKFWDRHYPPLDWRCRCDVVATAEDETKVNDKELPAVKFVGNVGKDKEIFTSKGSFFQLLKTNDTAFRNAELSKLAAPHDEALTYRSKANKTVKVSLFKDDNDFDDNYERAKIIVDQLKINVEIRAHVKVSGFKNPEYFINKNLSDLKFDFKKDNYKGIKNAFDAARKQKITHIVFDFTTAFKKLDISEVNRQIKSNINDVRGKQFKEIILIYKKKAIVVSREEIVNNQLLTLLEKLKANP
jgi:SPP1 gp7 family putative phage head morphogenesis protein